MVFTVNKKVFCVLEFAKTESFVTVQRRFQIMYHTEPPTDKTIREWYMNCFVCRWFCVVHDLKPPLHSHNWLSFGKFQDTERFLIHCESRFSSRLPPSGGTWKYAKALTTKKTWTDSLPIDMRLSAVSILVVAQSSSEIPEGLMNNPVYTWSSVTRALIINMASLRNLRLCINFGKTLFGIPVTVVTDAYFRSFATSWNLHVVERMILSLSPLAHKCSQKYLECLQITWNFSLCLPRRALWKFTNDSH